MEHSVHWPHSMTILSQYYWPHSMSIENIERVYRPHRLSVLTTVKRLMGSSLSSCASMVWMKSSCRLINSSTDWIESPKSLSLTVDSRESIHASITCASRRKTCAMPRIHHQALFIIDWKLYIIVRSLVYLKIVPCPFRVKVVLTTENVRLDI